MINRWKEENHGMDVESTDLDWPWRRHGDCTLARQCVQCRHETENAAREACVACYKNEMDASNISLVQHGLRPMRSLGLVSEIWAKRFSPSPQLFPPSLRDSFTSSETTPKTAKGSREGREAVGMGGSGPPPGGRSTTPGPEVSQEMPPNLSPLHLLLLLFQELHLLLLSHLPGGWHSSSTCAGRPRARRCGPSSGRHRC